MKLLLILVAVLGVIWLWRSRLPPEQTPDDLAPHKGGDPVNMSRCTVCGVHVPEAELIPGEHGTYCSDAHLHQREP